MGDAFFPEYPSEVLSEYVYRELQRVAFALPKTDVINLEITYVEPDKPREGDIRYADGVRWNPPNGIGKGLYLYDGDIWRPFG